MTIKNNLRLIISDLHIGSVYSKEEEILAFLKSMSFDELILAGDIIDFIKIPQFTKKSSELFNYLVNLNKPIIYIIGNHDISFKNLINLKINNFEFKEVYDFQSNGRKFRVVHGHQYDNKLFNWHYPMAVISVFHDYLERIFKINVTNIFTKFLTKIRKLREIWDIIRWNEEVDVIIMGHTHKPEVLIWINESGKIKTYANCGDWVDHKSYIIINDDQLRLEKYENKLE